MVYPDDQTSNAYSYVKLNEEGEIERDLSINKIDKSY